MKRIIYLSIIFLIYGKQLVAQHAGKMTHQEMIRKVPYLLYLPVAYDTDTAKRYPLVMFLHGSGESGSDLEKVKRIGLPKIIAQGKQFPFILISPQAGPTGWDEEELYHLLQNAKSMYRVDNNRVYLTGVSMGGGGTWELAKKHPEEFAAIVPICGGRDTMRLYRLRNVPVWAFQGLKDDVAPPQRMVEMVNVLKKYNPSVKLTLYPEANHNSWDTTYQTPALYTWLLQQKRFRYREVKLEKAQLDRYIGSYLNGTDTIQVTAENDRLILRWKPYQELVMKPAIDELFFVGQYTPVDLQFIRQKNRQMFILTRQTRLLFRKIN